MIEILEQLKRGSTEIGPIYKKCVEMWSDVLDDAEDLPVGDLAEKLYRQQKKIENVCCPLAGGIQLGKTITAVSGFSYLYDKCHGFSENSTRHTKLLQAFDNPKSSVAQEVKYRARVAGSLFHIT